MAQDLGKDIQIKIITKAKQENEVDVFEEVTTGRYFQKGETYFIRYQETKHDQGSVTFKINPDASIQLTRQSADLHLRLIFKDQGIYQTQYRSQYGMIPLEAKTIAMEWPLLADLTAENNVQGEIKIDYALYSQNKLVGDYEIRLQFHE
ncbi:DUF1934 domain-containing protein [Ligilactobacillus ceti]|uniref:DUF1934 domain-containing protein n=1 Tax=Ligilactobacillus ceti DSM 22408 TaxID=1122146 RepID=A0A0R2KJ50_9LACO|nr:DUF1934 domain-containing protein [Ligilactobacillus ceti]KRN89423.1 hypothetical protein IV53_GL000141 [Ligilactobacillus ceti DSM 22408]